MGEEVVADTNLATSQYVLNRRLGYHGLLKVPANALYTFHIFANPGLTLAIDGEVIHNKRRIGLQRIWKETVALQAGYHDIQMLFSDNSIKEGDPLLDIKLEYGGSGPQPIPPEWLFHR